MNPEFIVAEHDHQADFSSIEARSLLLLNAPIIVTTAVFETRD